MQARPRGDDDGPSDEREGLWITSEPRDDGSYIAVLSVDGDRSWSLSPFEARRHALAAIHAAACADYDEAVYDQMATTLGLDQDVVLQMIARLRVERSAVDDATSPLRFVPGLNAEGKGFVHISLDGTLVGQIDTDATRDHATNVLELVAVAGLDAAYRRLLVSDIELTDDYAKAAVSNLIDHRTSRP